MDVKTEVDVKTENEKKKEYLWGYRRAQRKKQRLEEQLQELRLNKMCPSVVQDGMPHGTGGGDLSGYAAKVDELEGEIKEAADECIEQLKAIRDKIEQLQDENEKDVLNYRYIRGMKWEDIAVKMGYSWRRTHYIHSSALNNFHFEKVHRSA